MACKRIWNGKREDANGIKVHKGKRIVNTPGILYLKPEYITNAYMVYI